MALYTMGGNKVGGQQEVMEFKAMRLTMLEARGSDKVRGNREQTLSDGIVCNRRQQSLRTMESNNVQGDGD